MELEWNSMMLRPHAGNSSRYNLETDRGGGLGKSMNGLFPVSVGVHLFKISKAFSD